MLYLCSMMEKSTMTEKLQYMALRVLFGAVALIPFPILYLISDCLAWLLDDAFGYRRKVVEDNLSASFPEISPVDLKVIRKRFYRFLTDYFLETLKMGGMSERQMMERMRFEGIEPVSRLLKEGHNVSLLLGHYCNWEWISSLPLHFPREAECGQIYHTLHNKAANRIFLRLRGRWHATSIPMEETLRVLLRWRREGKASVVGYIADQAPKWHSIHHWLTFLNHETGVFTGPEQISRKLHCAVYYMDVRRPKRGYYVATFVPVCEDAAEEPLMSITDRYFQMLQSSIERTPEFWLWSHKRWKRSRQEYERMSHRNEM